MPLINPYIYVTLMDPLKLMKIVTKTLVRNSSNTEVIPIGSENWRPLGVTGLPEDETYT